MTAMRAVGTGHRLPARAKVRGDSREYLIELDVSGFLEGELAVEALGPVLTVRGDQVATNEDEGVAFRLHERLEESFRLPDDAELDRIEVIYTPRALEIRAPRARLTRRVLPIRHRSPYLVRHDAEPC
jgi:HSP20 family molecular chaperone IbpA